jgi:hypothetical protein
MYLESHFRAFGCFWSNSKVRYDIRIERGSFVFDVLRNYRFQTRFRVFSDNIESSEQRARFEAFLKQNGDRSWWEGYGHRVKYRQRFLGFEYAAGEYLPPFYWQHPMVPFVVYQVPLLFFLVVPALMYLVLRLERRIQSSKPMRMIQSPAFMTRKLNLTSIWNSGENQFVSGQYRSISVPF